MLKKVVRGRSLIKRLKVRDIVSRHTYKQPKRKDSRETKKKNGNVWCGELWVASIDGHAAGAPRRRAGGKWNIIPVVSSSCALLGSFFFFVCSKAFWP